MDCRNGAALVVLLNRAGIDPRQHTCQRWDDMPPEPAQTGNANPSLGWARGLRPTWGRGACLVRWALDVGLDSFALSCQEERAKKYGFPENKSG